MEPVIFGRVRHYEAETTSTQDAARTYLEKYGQQAIGAAFAAGYQSAGRGRQGRTWYAPPGANVITTYIGNLVPLADLWQTAFVAAVAVADAVAQGVPVHLRFPNDLLLRGRKAAGVLIEAAQPLGIPVGTAVPLIGVGINVRGTAADLPPEVAVRATTIEAETGTRYDVETVESHLSDALTHRWNQWRTDGIAPLLAAWHKYHDAAIRRTFVLDTGETALCRVVSVSPDGIVTLETSDGARHVTPVSHVLLT